MDRQMLLLTGRYARLRMERKAIRLLSLVLRLSDDAPELTLLREHALALTEALLTWRRALHHAPALPAAPDGTPRLMHIARELAESGGCTAYDMLLPMTEPEAALLTVTERASLPLAAAAAQAERLCALLHTLAQDDQQRRTARRLAIRLSRQTRPMAYLARQELSLVGMHELLLALREKQQLSLLTALEEWLELHATSVDSITQRCAQRQTQLAAQLRQVCDCFEQLRLLNWTALEEPEEPLHHLLLEDPSGLYPQLQSASRTALRQAAGLLARRFHMDEHILVQACITLAQEAETRSLESHVGYYLTELPGILRLHRETGARRGRLWLIALRCRPFFYRALLWIFGTAAGFGFLQARQPILLLPALLLVAGSGFRWFFRRFDHPAAARAGVEIELSSEDVRTLVVLPAVLHDSSEAIAMVRRLWTVSHALPAGTDCLLLGDFPPAMTLYSSEDALITTAAANAVDVLNSEERDTRFMYLHRTRSRDDIHYAYKARNDRRGALETICRLIAQGECEDVLQHATFEPASLHRRYAFVLSLTADADPAPGMLEALLAAASHPANTRYPTGAGFRGFSILTPRHFAAPAFTGSALHMLSDELAPEEFRGVGLIRPDAFLESTDSRIPPELSTDASLLEGALSGTAVVPEAAVRMHMPVTVRQRMARVFSAVHSAWLTIPWQLPWVQTPGGFIRNPLMREARFRLREALRESLVPLGQCLLLLWALLTRSWVLLAVSLLLPALSCFSSSFRQSAARFVYHTALLPARTGVQTLAAARTLWQLLRHPREPYAPSGEHWPLIEAWSQGVMAAVSLALGIALPPVWFPALALGGLFACYPLLHARLDAPIIRPEALSDADENALSAMVQASWLFFCTHVTEATRFLPPRRVQTVPDRGTDMTTSPEAIAMYLLACICAKDMGFIDEAEAADRLSRSMDALDQLPMPDRLPCRAYALPSLTIAEAGVDAWSCGLLLAALMTCAQALRTWLPALPEAYSLLPARLDRLADRLDLRRLYQADTGLFFRTLDADGQGETLSMDYADAGLLLSFAACARGAVSPEHMERLFRTCVQTSAGSVMLTEQATASACLLAGLFLPIDPVQAERFVWLMQKRGTQGLFGMDRCAAWDFDPAMRYQQHTFGLHELSKMPVDVGAVYAPYAAALSLPFAPKAAMSSLLRMRDLGALGRLGFCDAIDLRAANEPRLVGLYDAFHQGVLLCAAAHMLADAPVQRCFCAIPAVEASLPLLHARHAPLLLPAPPPIQLVLPSEDHAAPPRSVSPLAAPMETCLLGADDAHMAVNARGSCFMGCGDRPLSRFSDDAGALCGLQVYLADEGRIFRVTDPTLPGETVFSGYAARFERICGSLRAVLTLCVDPAHHRFLHQLEITNLSTVDRNIEAADCLLPDLHAPADLLEGTMQGTHLTLRRRDTGLTLHHTFTSGVRPEALIPCTDAAAFLGQKHTLHHPASLSGNPVGTAGTDCLAFRARFRLPGRGQITLLFSTGLTDAPLHSSDLSGTCTLARMQAEAIRRSIPLSPEQEANASAMAGALLWRGQPHQQHVEPPATDELMSKLQLSAELPLLVIEIQTENGLTLLLEALNAAAFLRMKGFPTAVCVLCPPALEPEASQYSLSDMVILTMPEPSREEALLARARLVLREAAGPLAAQLAGLRRMLPPPEAAAAPAIPGAMPDQLLLHSSGYGGFDPENGDYVLRLAPGQHTPGTWQNLHRTQHAEEATDDAGLHTTFTEHVRLTLEDGTVIDPFDGQLPRSIRFGTGITEWRTYAEGLDVRLTAALLPDHAAGLRAARVRNTGDKAQRVRLTALIRFSAECGAAAAFGELILAQKHEGCSWVCGLDDLWEARCTSALTAFDASGRPAALPPDEAAGDTAVLTCLLTVSPGGSVKAAWLCGSAGHAEEAEAVCQAIQQEGASAIFRDAQEQWAPRLSALTIHTPEETLDLLVNRLLPQQLYTAPAPLPEQGLLLACTEPEALTGLLTECAERITSPTGRLLLTLIALRCIRITGDRSLWEAPLSGAAPTLGAACIASVKELALDSRGLPSHRHPAAVCLLAAAAAGALHAFTEDETFSDLRRRLLNAADAYLWENTHYASQGRLTLSAQSWAALAYGADTRAKQAVLTAWEQLYEPQYGLVRQHQPEEQRHARPGTLRNGGQDTRQAVWFLMALLKTGQTEQAWELLRALNPIHHTDDPARTEEFRAAPFLLHGGMAAAPAAEAGRAYVQGGTAAAGWLYACILEDMLGLVLRGDTLTLQPHVPADWDGYAITLRRGGATWHISLERSALTLTIDGKDAKDAVIRLVDDGKVHQVRAPLT